MLVVAQYTVLGEPEALCPDLGEPRDELVTSSDVSCHGVRSGNVASNVDGDKGSECDLIGRPECVCGAAICERPEPRHAPNIDGLRVVSSLHVGLVPPPWYLCLVSVPAGSRGARPVLCQAQALRAAG
jgi:hypothetical protein